MQTWLALGRQAATGGRPPTGSCRGPRRRRSRATQQRTPVEQRYKAGGGHQGAWGGGQQADVSLQAFPGLATSQRR